MFGKDELSSILRFGAEDLFRPAGSGQPEGCEERAAEATRRLQEEDIDAILERAEVVDSRAVSAAAWGGMGVHTLELRSQMLGSRVVSAAPLNTRSSVLLLRSFLGR